MSFRTGTRFLLRHFSRYPKILRCLKIRGLNLEVPPDSVVHLPMLESRPEASLEVQIPAKEAIALLQSVIRILKKVKALNNSRKF